jgi:hypothetical protein
MIRTALDRVRSAADGLKHFTLRNQALLLGGIADQASFSDAEAVQWLLDAMPPGVQDWNNARKTAEWGLTNGRARPLDLTSETTASAADLPRKETARAACRLFKMGLPTDEVMAALHDSNQRRTLPLPSQVIGQTALWAAKQVTEARHAR